MALVPKRVLIINRQLSFSVRIKQALEQSGEFDVTAFTSIDTALDHLRTRPYDVVLVDLTLSGIETILGLRKIQPGIAIVASPRTPDVLAQAESLHLNGIVDLPISARALIPVLRSAIEEMNDYLPDTMEAVILPDTETTLIETPKEFSSLDSVLSSAGGLVDDGTDTIELVISDMETSLQEEADEAVNLFQRLAADEPPRPGLEENGTISDLRSNLTHSDKQDDTTGEPALPPQPEEQPSAYLFESFAADDDESAQESSAHLVLRNTLDDTAPLVLSLNDLLEQVEKQFPTDASGVKPLPSWMRDIERYVQEPDFLNRVNLSFETTRMSEVPTSPVNAETEVLETPPIPPLPPVPKPPKQPANEQVEEPLAAQPTDDESASNTGSIPDTPPPNAVDVGGDRTKSGEAEADTESVPSPPAFPPVELPPYVFEDTEPEPEAIPEPPAETREEIVELPPYEFDNIPQPAADEPPLRESTITRGTDSDDPRIARLALSLTQASLDLTAEATLLTRDGEIVAYAGELPIEDIEDIHHIIRADWEVAQTGEARVRFIILPSSGEDYMIYSRLTESGFMLSMFFIGNMPLRAIRRQGERLINALTSIPDVDETQSISNDELQRLEAEIAQETESVQESQLLLIQEQQKAGIAQSKPEPQVLSPYTYIWLIRNPERPLTAEIAQAIVDGMDHHLGQEGWDIHTLHVFEDYVYLLAGVPGDTMANEVMNKLMGLSARIAQQIDPDIDAQTLWDDSYCVLTPGREFQQDEIQQFINFSRLR